MRYLCFVFLLLFAGVAFAETGNVEVYLVGPSGCNVQAKITASGQPLAGGRSVSSTGAKIGTGVWMICADEGVSQCKGKTKTFSRKCKKVEVRKGKTSKVVIKLK